MAEDFDTIIEEEVGESAHRLDTMGFRQRLRLSKKTLLRTSSLLGGLFLLLLIVTVLIARIEHLAVAAVFILPVMALAFLFETLDSSAGMGFGTALAPLLLLLGYDPLQIVPALLISQAISGLVAGFMHHEFENVHFSLRRPLNPSMTIVFLLSTIGLLGSVVSIVVAYVAFQLPAEALKIYIAILVILMGGVGLIRLFLKTNVIYRPRRLVFFALVAGVNKGIAGGGYGPVVTLGQIFAGVHEKSAAAITTFSEGIISAVAALVYIALLVAGEPVDLVLVPSLLAGAVIAAIVSPYIVRVAPTRLLAIFIPSYAIGLGLFALAQLL